MCSRVGGGRLDLRGTEMARQPEEYGVSTPPSGHPPVWSHLPLRHSRDRSRGPTLTSLPGESPQTNYVSTTRIEEDTENFTVVLLIDLFNQRQ